MAKNKFASIRYRILDKCFSNPGKRYFIDDLIEECDRVLSEQYQERSSISRRQIFDDIAFMESEMGWGVDLERLKDGRKVYYRYADINFSIEKMPLNEEEINKLKEAIDILTQFKGLPQFEWVHELIPKLKQDISTSVVNNHIIDFDNNQYLKGIEKLGILYSAIFYKKVLKITYQPFDTDIQYAFLIHPYYLKQYNNRWFLFGYNPEQKKSNWNLALDRIINIKELKEKFKPNNEIDWSEYFEDIVGVTKPENGEIENITLHFNGITGKYIESKPIHGSQKSKWIKKDLLEVKLSLIINYEFERLLLSYADCIEVVSPKSLRSRMVTKLKVALNIY